MTAAALEELAALQRSRGTARTCVGGGAILAILGTPVVDPDPAWSDAVLLSGLLIAGLGVYIRLRGHAAARRLANTGLMPSTDGTTLAEAREWHRRRADGATEYYDRAGVPWGLMILAYFMVKDLVHHRFTPGGFLVRLVEAGVLAYVLVRLSWWNKERRYHKFVAMLGPDAGRLLNEDAIGGEDTSPTV